MKQIKTSELTVVEHSNGQSEIVSPEELHDTLQRGGSVIYVGVGDDENSIVSHHSDGSNSKVRSSK